MELSPDGAQAEILSPVQALQRHAVTRGAVGYQASGRRGVHTHTTHRRILLNSAFREFLQQHLGEFGESCFKHLGYSDNVRVDNHPSNQSQRATCRPGFRVRRVSLSLSAAEDFSAEKSYAKNGTVGA